MVPDLARYLDKTVHVSIPVLFEDGVCRPFRLVGADSHGLWLESPELTRRLLPREGHDLAAMTPVAFVPYAQIAGVLIATRMPPAAPSAEPPPAPGVEETPQKRRKKH